jgi:hypothetical protein
MLRCESFCVHKNAVKRYEYTYLNLMQIDSLGTTLSWFSADQTTIILMMHVWIGLTENGLCMSVKSFRSVAVFCAIPWKYQHDNHIKTQVKTTWSRETEWILKTMPTGKLNESRNAMWTLTQDVGSSTEKWFLLVGTHRTSAQGFHVPWGETSVASCTSWVRVHIPFQSFIIRCPRIKKEKGHIKEEFVSGRGTID